MWQEKVTSLEEENRRLSIALEQAQAMLAALIKSKDLAMEEISKRKLQQDQSSTKMAQLEQALDKSERQRKEEVMERNEAVLKEITTLKIENARLRIKKGGLENKINFMTDERQELESKNANLQEERHAFQDKWIKLTKEREDLEDENTGLKEEVIELRHRLEKASLEESKVQSRAFGASTPVTTEVRHVLIPPIISLSKCVSLVSFHCEHRSL